MDLHDALTKDLIQELTVRAGLHELSDYDMQEIIELAEYLERIL